MTENLNVYYYSDPDGSTKDLRCHAIYTEIPFSELPWHVHTEKPDESLQDPVWSLEANGWVESSKDNQGALIAKQAEVIENLQKTSAEKDQAITELQRTLQQSSFATGQLSAQFNQFGSSVTKALQEVTTAVNELKKDGDK